MKKIYFLLVVGFALPLSAETISSVSYNPSRLGQYQKLRVSDAIVFVQGLQTTNLNVTKQAEFNWQDGGGTYQINSINSSENASAVINMAEGVVEGVNGTLTNYQVADLNPSNGTQVFLNGGGKVNFLDDSFAGNVTKTWDAITRSFALASHVNSLIVSGAGNDGSLIDVEGAVEGESLSEFADGNGGVVRRAIGLVLAGGNIPTDGFNPGETDLGWCDREACTNSGSDCNSGVRVKLLGYNCGSTSPIASHSYHWVRATSDEVSSMLSSMGSVRGASGCPLGNFLLLGLVGNSCNKTENGKYGGNNGYETYRWGSGKEGGYCVAIKCVQD